MTRESLGTAVLTLSVDADQFNSGLNQSRQQVTRLGNSFDSAGSGVSGFTGEMEALKGVLAAIGFGVIAGQIINISNGLIQASGAAQRLNASFAALGGSAQAADQLRNQLFLLSKTTPFRNEEILETARRFLAVGVSVDSLNGTINRLGSLAAQSGQSLDRIGLIYSQVFAKGRLQGEENLQFLEAGIDLTRNLSRVTGLYGSDLQAAMSKGRISITDVNKAIALATGNMVALVEGGKAVDVALNNIGDNLQQVSLGFANAVAPAFSASFGITNSAFERLFPNLEEVDRLFKPLTDQAERFSKALAANPKLVDTVASAFESLLSIGINGAVEGMEKVNAELEKNPVGLIQTVTNLEFGIRRAALLAIGLVKVLTSPARVGGVLNPDTVRPLYEGIRDIREALAAEPITVQVRPVPPQSGTAGDLPNKPGGGSTDTAGVSAAKELREASRELEAVFFAGRVTARAIGTEGLQRSAIQGAGALVDAGLNLRNAITDGLSGPALRNFFERLRESALSFKDTLTSGIKQATNSLEDARESLLSLRIDNSRFLSPEERQRNAAQLNADFQRAQRESGRTINISGSAEFVQQEQRAFIDFVKSERRGQENISNLEQGLATATVALAATNKTLSGDLSNLAKLVPGLTEALAAVGGRDNNITVFLAPGQTVPVPTGLS